MKIFVTGASGYAGFYAALRLAATGHTVTGIVRHPEQPRLNILRMQEAALLTGDVCEPATYRSELARSDVIIHTMLDKKRPLETALDLDHFRPPKQDAPRAVVDWSEIRKACDHLECPVHPST